MGRVEAHQECSFRQLPRPLNHPIQKGDEAVPAVLAALAKIETDAPTFLAKVCRYGRIPVKALVCSGHALFPGIRVVHGEHVDVQRHPSHGPGRNRRFHRFEHLDGAGVDDRRQQIRVFVKALPQCLFGRRLSGYAAPP